MAAQDSGVGCNCRPEHNQSTLRPNKAHSSARKHPVLCRREQTVVLRAECPMTASRKVKRATLPESSESSSSTRRSHLPSALDDSSTPAITGVIQNPRRSAPFPPFRVDRPSSRRCAGSGRPRAPFPVFRFPPRAFPSRRAFPQTSAGSLWVRAGQLRRRARTCAGAVCPVGPQGGKAGPHAAQAQTDSYTWCCKRACGTAEEHTTVAPRTPGRAAAFSGVDGPERETPVFRVRGGKSRTAGIRGRSRQGRRRAPSALPLGLGTHLYMPQVLLPLRWPLGRGRERKKKEKELCFCRN